MKKIFILLITSLVIGCSKQVDYGYLNTDRRPQVTIISERYTNPPDLNPDNTWKYYKVVEVNIDKSTDYKAYINLNPDTLISSCSIDKVDSNFRIEIRKYIVK